MYLIIYKLKNLFACHNTQIGQFKMAGSQDLWSDANSELDKVLLTNGKHFFY